MATSSLFCYMVLVGMSRVPLHARSTAVAQTILGRACTRIELAPPEPTPEDDDREFFMAAWCLDPCFVPEEQTIFIPEPVAAIPGDALYLRADEDVIDGLPGLNYQVRIRIVEVQDWSPPPPASPDDGYDGGHHDDDSSDDSNHNRCHPGLDMGGNHHWEPRTFRTADARDDVPRLGGRCGPMFMPAPCRFGGLDCLPAPRGWHVAGTPPRHGSRL